MATLDEKTKALEENGFIEIFTRDIYVNSSSRKVFSLEAIQDHDPEWLHACIKEPNPANEWQFYTTQVLDDKLKNDIIREIS